LNKEQQERLREQLNIAIHAAISKEMVVLSASASKIPAEDLKNRMMALDEAGHFCRAIITDFVSRMAGQINI
jgi:hypothetical protein